MRRLTMLTAVTALLGGCVSLNPPPPAPRPAVVQSPQAAPEPEAPRQATPPPRVTPRPREVRIDNSSLDSFRTSWERLRASLSPTQQTDLNAAVARLTFARYGGGTDLPKNLRASPIVPEIIRDQIAGLSYSEIIALAL